MAIQKGNITEEKYGIRTEFQTQFSKFKVRRDKKTRELKYRSRENKSNKLSRDFYNVKGQIIFRIKVSSYKVVKKKLIRDFVTEEEVIVEQSFISQHKKESIENAKLQALYSHYRKKGSNDLINNTKRLKNEIVKFELLDYMINYNKGYNRKLKTSRLRLSKDNNNFNSELYSEKDNKYEFYTSSPKSSVKKNIEELESQALQQEKIYGKYINLY